MSSSFLYIGLIMEQLYEDSFIRKIVTLISEAAACIALSFCLVYSFGAEVTNPGQSMQPVIEDGDRLLVNRAAYRIFGPKRYDIAVFINTGTGTENVKRIIGLPGETIWISDGRVMINGKPLPGEEGELYGNVVIPGIAEMPVELGDNEYFMIGDNSDASEDSRFESIGCVSSNLLEGKVWFRIGPFERIGRIR